MDDRLKQTIYWTLFVVIAFMVVFIILIPMVITVYFPDAKIVSNIQDIIGIASTIIGALSAGLGFFSIYQANQGNKQVNKILDTVQEISLSQQTIFSKISESGTSIVMVKGNPSTDGEWPKDPTKS